MDEQPQDQDQSKQVAAVVVDDGSDRNVDAADSLVKVQTVPQRSWRSYLWDTFDRSPEERKFLFKLDGILLTYASLGYFIKYLDQVNVNNAFVSGMKEDLGLYGNQLNYMQTLWTVGYVLGEIPRYLKTRSYRLEINANKS